MSFSKTWDHETVLCAQCVPNMTQTTRQNQNPVTSVIHNRRFPFRLAAPLPHSPLWNTQGPGFHASSAHMRRNGV